MDAVKYSKIVAFNKLQKRSCRIYIYIFFLWNAHVDTWSSRRIVSNKGMDPILGWPFMQRSDWREVTLALATRKHCKAICITSGFPSIWDGLSLYSHVTARYILPHSRHSPPGSGGNGRRDKQGERVEYSARESGEYTVLCNKWNWMKYYRQSVINDNHNFQQH